MDGVKSAWGVQRTNFVNYWFDVADMFGYSLKVKFEGFFCFTCCFA
jgi:hypothetical protein